MGCNLFSILGVTGGGEADLIKAETFPRDNARSALPSLYPDSMALKRILEGVSETEQSLLCAIYLFEGHD